MPHLVGVVTVVCDRRHGGSVVKLLRLHRPTPSVPVLLLCLFFDFCCFLPSRSYPCF